MSDLIRPGEIDIRRIDKELDEMRNKINIIEEWQKTTDLHLNFLKACLKDSLSKQHRMVVKDMLGEDGKLLIVDLKEGA